MSEAVLSPSPAQRLALPALILGGLAIGSSPIFVRLSESGRSRRRCGGWRWPADPVPVVRASAPGARRRGRTAWPTMPRWPCPACSSPPPGGLALGPIAVTLGRQRDAAGQPGADLRHGWRLRLVPHPIRPIFAAGLAVAIIGVVVLKGGPGAFGATATWPATAWRRWPRCSSGGYILSVGRLRDRFLGGHGDAVDQRRRRPR